MWSMPVDSSIRLKLFGLPRPSSLITNSLNLDILSGGRELVTSRVGAESCSLKELTYQCTIGRSRDGGYVPPRRKLNLLPFRI